MLRAADALPLAPGLAHPPTSAALQDNSTGRKSQARTYPDLLQGPYDEHVSGCALGGSGLFHVLAQAEQGSGHNHRVVHAWCLGTSPYSPPLFIQPSAQLFEYYCQSQLVTVKVSTGEVTTIGPSRLYTATSASPDGRYLLVSWLDRPYSYSLPCGRFPKKVQLWTR